MAGCHSQKNKPQKAQKKINFLESGAKDDISHVCDLQVQPTKLKCLKLFVLFHKCLDSDINKLHFPHLSLQTD